MLFFQAVGMTVCIIGIVLGLVKTVEFFVDLYSDVQNLKREYEWLRKDNKTLASNQYTMEEKLSTLEASEYSNFLSKTGTFRINKDLA